MPLISNLFRNNQRLQACLTKDSAHVMPGTTGDHVYLIQIALIELDNHIIKPEELDKHRYGTSTSEAVLSFKKKRRIINHAYQNTEDNIVGKMTIKTLDKELFDGQSTPFSKSKQCARTGQVVGEHPQVAILIGKRFKVA